MADHLREAVFHSLVASLIVEAVLRLWRVDEPELKLRLRLFVVAMPLVLVPAFELLAPFRHRPPFEDGLALFVSRRWASVRLFGIPANRLWLAGLSAASVALLVIDFRPWLREWRRGHWAKVGTEPCPPGLEARVADLARALGLEPPRVLMAQAHSPVLFTRGVRAPVVCISQQTIDRLDAEELDGALAHELAHLAHRDVQLGWLVLAARLLQAFNPVAQVLARPIALDVEERADDTAVKATRRPLALASGLISMFRGSVSLPSASEVLLQSALRQVREATIEDRCRRLMHDRPRTPPGHNGVLTAATMLVISTLTFFIT